MVHISKVKRELRKLKPATRYTFEVDLGRAKITKIDLITGSRLFDAYIRLIGYSFIGIYEEKTGFFLSHYTICCKNKYQKNEGVI